MRTEKRFSDEKGALNRMEPSPLSGAALLCVLPFSLATEVGAVYPDPNEFDTPSMRLPVVDW